MSYRLAVGLGRPARKTCTVCCLCATTSERRICGQGRHKASCHSPSSGGQTRALACVGHTGSHAWGELSLYCGCVSCHNKPSRRTRNPRSFTLGVSKDGHGDDACPTTAWAVGCPCVSAAWNWTMVARIPAATPFLPCGRRPTGAKGWQEWIFSPEPQGCAGSALGLWLSRSLRPRANSPRSVR
jgi:hypothetical protein